MTSPESNSIVLERRKSSFNIEELTFLLDGGKHKTALRHDIGKDQYDFYAILFEVCVRRCCCLNQLGLNNMHFSVEKVANCFKKMNLLLKNSF